MQLHYCLHQNCYYGRSSGQLCRQIESDQPHSTMGGQHDLLYKDEFMDVSRHFMDIYMNLYYKNLKAFVAS